jgi:hypothetical protein
MQQILSGVRDEDKLCDELDLDNGAIVVEVLKRLQESH